MIGSLHRLLPASGSIVTDVRTLTADNVLRALDEQGVPYKVCRLCAGDWEIEGADATDDDIFNLVHLENAGHEGALLICTEACTRHGLEPFHCAAADLRRFVSDYRFENFFDGDVIILGEESRTLTVFHHGGVFVHAKI